MQGNANELLKSAYHGAAEVGLPWAVRMKATLEVVGMGNFYVEQHSDKPIFVYKRVFGRMVDIFHQNSFEKIRSADHKLRTYAFFKRDIGMEEYLNGRTLLGFGCRTIVL